ncbi:hypothetical protein BLNAU_4603 [Blattamonas nauphoetae]|uniref:RIIa domain-containing protein n=1 Tax=Blattamonas nauphoetae TaxID=2049346 RepID=A0ABQ9Y9D0_9EUKA|nr:hypothetical protein BLNAU_4603 [Blattamonas nauphoetae]
MKSATKQTNYTNNATNEEITSLLQDALSVIDFARPSNPPEFLFDYFQSNTPLLSFNLRKHHYLTCQRLTRVTGGKHTATARSTRQEGSEELQFAQFLLACKIGNTT